MNIQIEAKHFRSQAEMVEEAKARRKRFEIAGRLAEMKKGAPLPTPAPADMQFVTKKLPAWESGFLTFDAHVQAYRVSMQISSFSLNGAVRLSHSWDPPKVRRSINDIVLEVLREFPNVSIEQIQSERRPKSITEPRQLAMHAVYVQRPDLSLPMIGRWFRKDHTTVLHAVRKIEERNAHAAAMAASQPSI